MEPLVGTWGIYPWSEEHGSEQVHSDDLDEFRRMMPSQAVFRCISVENDFIVIEHGSHRFRVKPKLFKAVTSPKFNFGDLVSFRKGDEIVNGIVSGIGWHFNRSEPFYVVTMSGKRLTRQYWASDLNLCSDLIR